MSLSLAISPCPNDTFIFGHWIQKTQVFNTTISTVDFFDIAELNQQSIHCDYDIIKISAAQIPYMHKDYSIIPTGGALGFGVGPLLIHSPNCNFNQVNQCFVPGKTTSAFQLLQHFYPQLKNIKKVIFSDIEESVLNSQNSSGLLIHENRFTYHKKGLQLEADLGKLWEQKYQLPIPLGVIAVRNQILNQNGKQLIQDIQKSIQSAYQNSYLISEFIDRNADNMDPKVQQRHIQLYVNSFSYNLGYQGILALEHFHNLVYENSTTLVQHSKLPLYLT